MHFGKNRRSSAKEKVKEEESLPASGGLLPVTTGFSRADAAPATAKTKTKPPQQTRQPPPIPQQMANNDDVLANEFDAYSGDAPSDTSPPTTLLPQQVATVESALWGVNQATSKLKQQMAVWNHQAIVCGKAALHEAKKHRQEDSSAEGGHQRTSFRITNECKFQLLRRKLLQINIANAERQLLQLEQTRQGLEKVAAKKRNRRKIRNETIAEVEERVASPHNLPTREDSSSVLLPLEREVEHVDVVEEILSRDLTADLFADEDAVSEVEYDEKELLRELHSLSSMDQDDTPSSEKTVKKKSARPAIEKRKTATLKKPSSQPKNGQSSNSSFAATLF